MNHAENCILAIDFPDTVTEPTITELDATKFNEPAATEFTTAESDESSELATTGRDSVNTIPVTSDLATETVTTATTDSISTIVPVISRTPSTKQPTSVTEDDAKSTTLNSETTPTTLTGIPACFLLYRYAIRHVIPCEGHIPYVFFQTFPNFSV